MSPADKLRTGEGYIKLLNRFKEPQIFPAQHAAEVYRLSINPTFDNPVLIRAVRDSNGYFLIAKRLSGQGSYDPGIIKREKKRRLSVREWQTLLKLLNKASFWDLPTVEKKPGPDERGVETICLDGSEWLIEGVRDGKYHAVGRYCPESRSFEAVGLYLMKLSRLGVKKRDLY